MNEKRCIFCDEAWLSSLSATRLQTRWLVTTSKAAEQRCLAKMAYERIVTSLQLDLESYGFIERTLSLRRVGEVGCRVSARSKRSETCLGFHADQHHWRAGGTRLPVYRSFAALFVAFAHGNHQSQPKRILPAQYSKSLPAPAFPILPHTAFDFSPSRPLFIFELTNIIL